MLIISLRNGLSPLSSFDPTSIIYAFDMVGIIACSISGTILARSKNFDPMGCILVAMVTAIGGGTVRDVMLDRQPLFWMNDLTYLTVITLTSLIFQAFFRVNDRVDRILQVSDAIGLSVFTLIGVKVALSYGMNMPVAMLMGIITIIVGGMIRDMICNELPLVLRQEIYITASMVGSGVYFMLQHFCLTEWVSEVVMMLTIFIIRMMAIFYDWHLPAVNTWFKSAK